MSRTANTLVDVHLFSRPQYCHNQYKIESSLGTLVKVDFLLHTSYSSVSMQFKWKECTNSDSQKFKHYSTLAFFKVTCYMISQLTSSMCKSTWSDLGTCPSIHFSTKSKISTSLYRLKQSVMLHCHWFQS